MEHQNKIAHHEQVITLLSTDGEATVQASQGQNRRRKIAHAFTHQIQNLVLSISPWSPDSSNSHDAYGHLHMTGSRDKSGNVPSGFLLINLLLSSNLGHFRKMQPG